MNTRRVPKRSTAQPASGIADASASRYAVETHWIVDSRASKTTASRSIATLTIVESRIVITAPQTTTAAAASTGRPSSRITVPDPCLHVRCGQVRRSSTVDPPQCHGSERHPRCQRPRHQPPAHPRSAAALPSPQPRRVGPGPRSLPRDGHRGAVRARACRDGRAACRRLRRRAPRDRPPAAAGLARLRRRVRGRARLRPPPHPRRRLRPRRRGHGRPFGGHRGRPAGVGELRPGATAHRRRARRRGSRHRRA